MLSSYWFSSVYMSIDNRNRFMYDMHNTDQCIFSRSPIKSLMPTIQKGSKQTKRLCKLRNANSMRNKYQHYEKKHVLLKISLANPLRLNG